MPLGPGAYLPLYLAKDPVTPKTPCNDPTCYCDFDNEGEPQVRRLEKDEPLLELDPTHAEWLTPQPVNALKPDPVRDLQQRVDLELLDVMFGDRAEEYPAILPTDAKARKAIPIATGVIDYFPAAIAEIAKLSKVGNDQHNPGEPLHWARGKSTDHPDTLMRHFLERGTFDTDGVRHSVKMAWRALALLQMELEADGAPVARGAR